MIGPKPVGGDSGLCRCDDQAAAAAPGWGLVEVSRDKRAAERRYPQVV